MNTQDRKAYLLDLVNKINTEIGALTMVMDRDEWYEATKLQRESRDKYKKEIETL